MPEIAEVARITHFLRLNILNKTIKSATALDDGNVFGKVGTSGPEVVKALEGKKVMSVGSQGKYFWITFDKPPHLVMHFGMTGWMHIRGERTAYTNYYKKMNDKELVEWPPKFWKFHFATRGTTEDETVEVAFTDARRFGRVRVVDCPGPDIRQYSPLIENGPDPVVDKDLFTEEYLRNHMRRKHVPVKALLLDQKIISGLGNWVVDETLYHAKAHPEQYCDTFNDDEIKNIWGKIKYVCDTATDVLGDSDQFPENWLFNYRWGKGDKNATATLPNNMKLAFITVGGRTSCYVPEVQKKTGQIPQGAQTEVIENGEAKKLAKTSRKSVVVKDEEETTSSPSKNSKIAANRRTSSKRVIKEETEDDKPSVKKVKKVKAEPTREASPGRRRSTRLRN